MPKPGISKIEQYITFSVGGEDYGVPVLEVLEIVRIENLIKVPHGRDYLLGMMDIRGQVLPVIDLKTKLQMEAMDSHPERAIIMQIGARKIGLGVDSVSHVRSFSSDNIDEGPPVLRSGSSRHIIGVGKSGDQFIVLMSLSKIFSPEEVEQFFAR